MARAWQWQAACADPGVDPQWWFSENQHAQDRAKAVCLACPVAAQCFQFALDSRASDGIWAGLDAQELRELGATTICMWCAAPFLAEFAGQRYCGEDCETAAIRRSNMGGGRRDEDGVDEYLELAAQGYGREQAAERLGVSKRTLERWITRARKAGAAA